MQLFPFGGTERVNVEQILAVFGIDVPHSRKIMCLNHDHKETVASMYVNDDHVFCFGCGACYDKEYTAYRLLSRKLGRRASRGEMLNWFATTKFPKSKRKYENTEYKGAVPSVMINYWREQLSKELQQTLYEERLITPEHQLSCGLGYRPDWDAWAIPYWRGEPGYSEVDIVQFRMRSSTEYKYLGLKGHSRASVINQHLLLSAQKYVIVFFGSFDPLLALQDGLIAVGLSGSTVFTGRHSDRLKDLFKLQSNIYIVPDNTDSEREPAEKVAEILGGKVFLWNWDAPKDEDYISFRKRGNTVEDFLKETGIVTP